METNTPGDRLRAVQRELAEVADSRIKGTDLPKYHADFTALVEALRTSVATRAFAWSVARTHSASGRERQEARRLIAHKLSCTRRQCRTCKRPVRKMFLPFYQRDFQGTMNGVVAASVSTTAVCICDSDRCLACVVQVDSFIALNGRRAVEQARADRDVVENDRADDHDIPQSPNDLTAGAEAMIDAETLSISPVVHIDLAQVEVIDLVQDEDLSVRTGVADISMVAAETAIDNKVVNTTMAEIVVNNAEVRDNKLLVTGMPQAKDSAAQRDPERALTQDRDVIDLTSTNDEEPHPVSAISSEESKIPRDAIAPTHPTDLELGGALSLPVTVSSANRDYSLQNHEAVEEVQGQREHRDNGGGGDNGNYIENPAVTSAEHHGSTRERDVADRRRSPPPGRYRPDRLSVPPHPRIGHFIAYFGIPREIEVVEETTGRSSVILRYS